MQGRTFLRTMFDNLLFKNPIYKAVQSFVKFYDEKDIFGQKKLKFSENNPFNITIKKHNYQKEFIFDRQKASGAMFK